MNSDDNETKKETKWGKGGMKASEGIGHFLIFRHQPKGIIINNRAQK